MRTKPFLRNRPLDRKRGRRWAVQGALVLPLVFGSVVSAQVTTVVDSINASGGLSIGPDGHLYVADFGNRLSNANGDTVYRVTIDGEVEVFATGFQGASGNAFDASGNLIQANIAGNRLDQIDPNGVVTTLTTGALSSPVGVAINDQGTIFVANCGNNSIVSFRDDTTTTVASGSPLSCPNGLTIDDSGNLYTANFNNGAVIKITPQGQTSVLASTPTSSFRATGGNGHITFAKGELFVASNATAQIFRLSLDGELSVVAGDGTRGHQDGDFAQASFSSPNGIAVSDDGVIYVNEADSTAGATLNFSTFPLNPSRIRAITLDDEVAINPGLNGSWYNPQTDGQGLLLDVIASQQSLFAAWFTFERPDHQFSPNDTGARWLTAFGSYAGATATLSIQNSTGGVFSAPSQVIGTDVGTATLNFVSCTQASLEYAIDGGPTGSIPLRRLTPDVLCTELNATARNGGLSHD